MKFIPIAAFLAATVATSAVQAQTAVAAMTALQLQTSTACANPVLITDPGKEGTFVSTADTSQSNGGTTLYCNANGGAGRRLYKRIYDSTINAKWFGLVEDTQTNTFAAQNSLAVQNAIASARNGQEVLIPEGFYTFANSITLPDSRYIHFTARGELKFGGNDGIIVSGHLGHVLDLTKLHGHAWEEIPSYGYTGAGITLVNAANVTVKVNWIDGFKTAIKLTAQGHNGSQYNKISFEFLDHNETGIQLTTENDGLPNWVNENTFTGGRISGLLGLSAIPGSGQKDRFNGNKFYNFGFEGATSGVDVDMFMGNMFIAPRMVSSEGVANGFKFSPSSEDNMIIASNGLYEDVFVSNGTKANAGVRTLLLGRLMTPTQSITSGVINIADSNGRFLGLIRDATPNPTNDATKSRILPLTSLSVTTP